jgi:DNA recombination protein RmuC
MDLTTLLLLLLALTNLAILIALLRKPSDAVTPAQLEQRLRDENSRLLSDLGQKLNDHNNFVAQQTQTVIGHQTTAQDRFRVSVDQRLEEIRRTVDEKLHETLEKRLGESFQRVSENLERVHKDLGETQTLAQGVGDLKKVLTNVKSRGTWGEFQLGALLEDMLTPEQYEQNVKIRPRSPEVVEFAIKLPGRDEEQGHVWLPIDAKFPKEDYERLIQAQEHGQPDLAEAAAKALADRIEGCARDIQQKYIHPPYSVDFGILFLPVESLYAEVLRNAGLVDRIQQKYRVTIAGPTTLTALLTSLQMGFKSLAIQKRSSEVWQVLRAVKADFGKFGGLLEKAKDQLAKVQDSLDSAATSSRKIENRLNKAEQLAPADLAATPVLTTVPPESEDSVPDARAQ